MKQLGIIAALPAEARCLTGEIDAKQAISSPQPLSEHVSLSISGIGAEQAANAASALIQHGADALLSWGCAGALGPDVQAGDLLLPQIILSEASDVLHTDSTWRAHLLRQLSGPLTPVSGALAGSANIITEVAQKQDLYQASGAVAVDMESAAIAMVAQKANIPFMVIRAIVDDAETSIPACINSAVDIYGNIKPVQMTALLLRHPASWPQLIKLGRQFSTAKATLSRVAETLGVDSLLPPGPA